MEWHDEGVVVSVGRHGETSAIAGVLTREHGRCLGLVRGGRSRSMRPVLQPGNVVTVTWRARLEEHLGNFSIEPISLKAAGLIGDPLRLAGLTTLTGLSALLPEREPHPRLHEALMLVLEALEEGDIWPALLVRWEMGLLEELGFGLDLSRCAATGSRDDLIYVSPKSGRAVSAGAGEIYKQRLFALPAFLHGSQAGSPTPEDIAAGFKLTGYFLDRHIFGPRGVDAPVQRAWLIAQIASGAHGG